MYLKFSIASVNILFKYLIEDKLIIKFEKDVLFIASVIFNAQDVFTYVMTTF